MCGLGSLGGGALKTIKKLAWKGVAIATLSEIGLV